MVTNSGNLKCKGIIHAVGPKYNLGALDHKNEEILMKNTICSILNLMNEKGYMAVSIPTISTDIYKFPLKKFSRIFAKTVIEFLDIHNREMKNRKIILCNLDEETTNTLLEAIPKFLEEFAIDNEKFNNKEKDEKAKEGIKKGKHTNEELKNDEDEEVKR